MSLSTLTPNLTALAGKSLLAVAVVNLIYELKSIRFDRTKKRWTIGSGDSANERIVSVLKQFGFIFGQLAAFNVIITLNSKKLTLPLGAAVAYLFSEVFDIKLPLLVSAYILAKLGSMLIERGAKLGIIKHEMLFYKVLFVALMGAMNIYIFAYPEQMPRRVYKNYMKIGRLTDVDRLQFDFVAGREPLAPRQN